MLCLNILKEYVKENKGLISIYLLVIIIAFPIEAMAMSYIYGKIFSQFNKGTNHQAIRNFFILAIIVWFLVKLCRYIKSKINQQLIPSFSRFTRNYIFDLILKKYKVNYSEPRIGDILTNISEIPWNLFSLATRILNEHLPIVLALLGIIAYTFYINVWFGLLLMVGTLLNLYLTYKTGGECVDVNMEEHKLFAELNEKIQDKVGNLFSIYTSNTEEYERLKNHIREKEMEAKRAESIGCSGRLYMDSAIISTIMFALSLFIIYRMYKGNMIETSLLITVTIMMTRYFSYFSSFFGGLGYTYHIIGTLKQVDHFLEPGVQSKAAKQVQIKKGTILFKNVSFKYEGSSKPILDNATFGFHTNSVNTIFGQSGIGKTTLVKLLMGFYKLNGGEIYIDGQSISNTNLDNLREQISFVNQKVDLFNTTVLDNIKYGNNATTAQIQRTIQQYRIMPVFKNLPNGLQTVAGVGGSNLSRGQRQTVLLLRALMRNTRVIIFDEPTSALDPRTKGVLMGMIKKVSASKTVIIITHDKDVLRYTDHKYQFANSKVTNL